MILIDHSEEFRGKTIESIYEPELIDGTLFLIIFTDNSFLRLTNLNIRQASQIQTEMEKEIYHQDKT